MGMTELNKNSYVVGVVDANSINLLTPDEVAKITGATQANPVVITTLQDHGLSNGDVIGTVGVSGMTDLNGNTYTTANVTATTFELSGIDGTAFGAYTSGGEIYHAENGSAYTAYISGGVANKKVTSITGLSHLEGETIKVFGDGAILPDETVSSATITINSAASVVQVGLGYTHTLKTLKISVGNPAGTALVKKKRIYGVTFFLLNSHTISYGPDTANLKNKEFRVVADDMDSAALLSTTTRVSVPQFPPSSVKNSPVKKSAARLEP